MKQEKPKRISPHWTFSATQRTPMKASIREMANKLYNPDIVAIDNTNLKIEPVASQKKWHDPKRAHVYAAICASLQYKFWYADSKTRLGVNSQWINDMVKEELDHCNVSITDLKPLLKDRLMTSNIPKLQERLDSLDDIFKIDLDLYGYYYKSSITSLRMLAEVPSFKKDPFFKKGLFAMMFSERLREAKYSDIPVPADYQIPKILEELGVIRYSAELKGIIDADTVIPEGSKYEVAIRAATILACDELAEYNKISTNEVDLWLFTKKDIGFQKHHLCDTTNY